MFERPLPQNHFFSRQCCYWLEFDAATFPNDVAGASCSFRFFSFSTYLNQNNFTNCLWLFVFLFSAWTFNQFFNYHFFVRKSFRLYIKWRCRWNIWYDGGQLENHDPAIVIFCCPWFGVDLWISKNWSDLSLSKLVRAIFSKLDWQCRYDFFRIWGRLKTSCLRIKTENKFRTGKIFTANCYFEFAGLRFKNGGWIC